ncbi:purine permease 1-like [Ipomoea triloba]|uniref:purine permease 1-like n=1 Tax=Ipomoea triloba TaxID=35885 RepID=UPI00125D5380|nr:purine permease 1-like [Ipomoea triloba]
MEISSVGSSHLRLRRRLLLIFSCIILTIGQCGGPLLTRLYFLHGGKRVWFSSWLQTVSFPVTFIPLAAAYFNRRKTQGPAAKLTFLTPKIFLASAFIGLLLGIDGYMNAFGVSKLPVSTSSLLLATQLAFTAGFAFLLVRQRFTPFSVNAIVLLTTAAAVLAIGADGDKPAGESTKDYILGFVLTLLAAALYGFFLPLIEYTYKMGKEGMTYAFVLELQCVMSFFATAFCTVGMIVNKDFQAISSEARGFDFKEGTYYVVVICSAIVWQLLLLGMVGVSCYGSSLLSGILLATLLSVTEVLAVVFFKEKFGAEKGVSLALSLWGFTSYFYGEVKNNKTSTEDSQTKDDDLDNNNNNNDDVLLDA